MKLRVKHLHTFTYNDFVSHVEKYLTKKYHMLAKCDEKGIQIIDTIQKYVISYSTVKEYYDIYRKKGILTCHNIIDQHLYNTLLEELLYLVQQDEQISEFVS